MIKYFDPKEMADAIQNVKTDFQTLNQELESKKYNLRLNEEEEKVNIEQAKK
jgi:hypothetical protein